MNSNGIHLGDQKGGKPKHEKIWAHEIQQQNSGTSAIKVSQGRLNFKLARGRISIRELSRPQVGQETIRTIKFKGNKWTHNNRSLRGQKGETRNERKYRRTLQLTLSGIREQERMIG